LEQWDNIKKEVSQALIDHGGTITHHHAVGKDHRPFYSQQHTPLFGNMLKAAKEAVEPESRSFATGVILFPNQSTISRFGLIISIKQQREIIAGKETRNPAIAVADAPDGNSMLIFNRNFLIGLKDERVSFGLFDELSFGSSFHFAFEKIDRNIQF
jgi:hypothetical protein